MDVMCTYLLGGKKCFYSSFKKTNKPILIKSHYDKTTSQGNMRTKLFFCIRLSSTRKGGFGSTADRLALVDGKEDLPGMVDF